MDSQKLIRLVLIAIPIAFILALIWHPLTPLPCLLIFYLSILLRRTGFFDTLFTRKRPPIPYYHPPQQAVPISGDPPPHEVDQPEPRYHQGYQAQVPYRSPLKYEETIQPPQDDSQNYEQPKAQYPEQMPPMPTI
ncbi:MAG TPA: hypothetical protein VKV37_10425 [Ktedonobacteraceae bacterium]|nr:hypothetical protein [Ktedonobacteraceae bacterium]